MKKILFGLMIGTLLFTACGKENGVTKNKSINVYTALENEQISVYLESFKESHPEIKLNIVRDSTGIIISKLLAEKGNPQADVVWGTAATGLLLLDKEGLLEPYAPEGLDRIDKKLRDQNKIPKWVGNNAWMTAFVVNTIELKKLGLPVPKNYKDLLNPKYKGLITMSNPASSGTGYLTVSAILQLMGEDKGWDYLNKLDKNIGVYVHSGSKPAKMAAAGEYVIGISYGYPGVSLKNSGSPVDVIFPTEGSGWDSEANALIKKKNIKPEANVFLNWAISNDAMKEYAKQYAITGADVGAKVPVGFPANPNKQLIKNDFNWAAENKSEVLAKWESNFGGKNEEK